MTEILLNTLSFTAFMLFAASASAFFSLLCPGEEKLSFSAEVLKRSCSGELLPVLLLLPAFLFVPVGSLPSYIYTEYSLYTVIFLFSLSHIVYRRDFWRYCEEYLYPDLSCAALFAAFSFYAYHSGIPGKTASFECFTLLNLWHELPPLAVLSYLMFALSSFYFLCEVVYSVKKDHSFYCAVERFLCLMVFTATYIPSDISFFFRLTGVYAYLADAASCLFTAFLLQSLVLFLRGRSEMDNKKRNTASAAVFLGFVFTILSVYLY